MTTETYLIALSQFRAASAAHSIITAAYRARTVDDATFITSRLTVEAASLVSDLAEAELLASDARAELANATTNKARRHAAEDLEFWTNKSALLRAKVNL